MTELNKIAFVEDDPDIRSIIKLALSDVGGFSVKSYASGMDAVAEIESFCPQLVILDMMMPGMDGVETMLELRKISALANTPIIFMTAKAQPNEIEKYKNTGAIGVIVKPFDPITLATKVRELWRTVA